VDDAIALAQKRALTLYEQKGDVIGSANVRVMQDALQGGFTRTRR
jgi:hypothetical protein